jgi:signal transduction histidine kinase
VECDFLLPAITALSRLGRYREALAYQQRFTRLSALAFDENARRQAQELDALYATRQREQQLAWQRQRIQQLQARTQVREATLRQRTLLLGALLLGALLLLVTVVVWLRARHLLATASATLNMRQRLATDLHDEVGTLLTRVSLQAELIGTEQPILTPSVERLLTNSRTAARTMRDVVWGLDPQADNTTSLLDRMREFLHQSTTPVGLEAELLTDNWPDDEALPQLLRQQVYLVFREAVTNAVKHAQGASCVRARLRREPGQLYLIIDDDGQPPVAAPTTSGLGLRSMRRRAESLGGTLAAGPRPESGFRVQLQVPLA